MRIGIDAHAAEQEGSGNCTYIRNLTTALIAMDRENEYTLYVIDKSHFFYADFACRSNVRLREIHARRSFLRIPFFLAAATFRDKLDILHVQYIGPPVHRGKLIATIHDLGFLHVPQTFSKPFVWRSKVLIRRTARHAARIITGSQFSMRDIKDAYGLDERKISIVPCGIAPVFFEPAGRERIEALCAKYEIQPPYILAVGRLNPRKNLVTLTRAFDRLKAEARIPHQLVLVGRKDFEATQIIAMIREIRKHNIVLTGFVPDEDLPVLYQGADIFVYPSLFEGVGLPLLEAMAAGTPVVTSNTSSLPEMAGDACLIVNPLDETELAEAIFRLAEDRKLWEECRRKGRLRAQTFTWEAAARRTLEIYNNSAAERGTV